MKVTANTLLFSLVCLNAQAADSVERISISAKRVSMQESASHFPMAITALRYEPQVDIMARGFAEGQGDVSIRGGIFENTGFRVGAATLFDPQTGHYFAEVPLAPQMLSSTQILTGADNALYGFNSTAGTVAYQFSEIANSGNVAVASGPDSLFKANTFLSYENENYGGQVEYSRSQSDGPVAGGDHDFERFSGRFQLKSDLGQTDIMLGYQDKFFGWPDMYTPFGLLESEDVQTRLLVLNHKKSYDNGSWFEVTAYHRNNRDHYTLGRGDAAPWTYEANHEMESAAIALASEIFLDESFSVAINAQYTTDKIIKSSSLTFGNFDSRDYAKLSVMPTYKSGNLSLAAGVTLDKAQYEGSQFSPVLKAEYSLDSTPAKLYAEYSEATQLPGYMVLAGSTSGLFAGNPDLGRETSKNYEIGLEGYQGEWLYSAALFYRQDDDLVDWVFSEDIKESGIKSAKQANAIDLNTKGAELFVIRQFSDLRLVSGYTWLDKEYKDTLFPGAPSFYAMNYARHRLTLNLSWSMTDHLSLHSDNEYRIQEENTLREGTDKPVLSSLGLTWNLPAVKGLKLEGRVDNLWDSNYQDVPAVTPTPRTWSVGVNYLW